MPQAFLVGAMQPGLTLATPRVSLPGCVALPLALWMARAWANQRGGWGFLFTLRLSALIRPYGAGGDFA